MNLHEYRDIVVVPKLLVKESQLDNCAHMISGMNSEFMSELTVALMKKDKVNVQEEIGDLEFFVVGLIHFYGLDLATEFEFETLELYQTEYKDVAYNAIMIAIGDVNTIFKKELTTGVRKLNGAIVDDEALKMMLNNILRNIAIYSHHLGFDMSDIRSMNARKLNVRHESGFTAESSLGRDTDKERDAMVSAQ